jgi:DNA-binding MarR family transcriptional regulator
MPIRIATPDYRALAELRFRVRHFLFEGDPAAREFGIEPQQYLLLLSGRELPEDTEATLRTLAGRLALKHNSAAELIDRMENHGPVHRIRDLEDRRCILVSLLPAGKKLLEWSRGSGLRGCAREERRW